jgi:hypothetical protein
MANISMDWLIARVHQYKLRIAGKKPVIGNDKIGKYLTINNISTSNI